MDSTCSSNNINLVEVIKLHTSHCSTDTRGDGLASISNKVGDGEDLRGLLLIVLVTNLKVPTSVKLIKSCAEEVIFERMPY